MAFLFSRDIEHIIQELEQIIEDNVIKLKTPRGKTILKISSIGVNEIKYDEDNSTRNKIVIGGMLAELRVTFNTMEDGSAWKEEFFEVRNIEPLILNYNQESDLYDLLMKDNAIIFR